MADKRKPGKAQAKRAVKQELEKKAPTNMEEATGWVRVDRPQDLPLPDFPLTLQIGKFKFRGKVLQPLASGPIPGAKPVKPNKKKKD
jgi:hypothetical protein